VARLDQDPFVNIAENQDRSAEISERGLSATLIPAQFPGAFCEAAVSSLVATALCRSEEIIRRQGKAQTEAVLAIGREFIAVKELLPSDEFGPWLRREFDLAEETAGAYMAAARKIAADPTSDKKC
jgi:hypothetical protein